MWQWNVAKDWNVVNRESLAGDVQSLECSTNTEDVAKQFRVCIFSCPVFWKQSNLYPKHSCIHNIRIVKDIVWGRNIYN